MSLPRHRIRLKMDPTSHTPVSCDFTGQAPKTWRGADVQFEIGLAWDGTILTDIVNVATLVLEIHDNADRDGSPLAQETLAAGSLKQNLTAELWAGELEANCHGLFAFTNAEMQLSLGTNPVEDKKTFWLVVHATTTDGTTRYITWGCAELTIEEDGAQNGLSVVSESPAYRISDGELQLWNPDESTWHTLYVKGAAGAEYLALGPGE